MLLSIQGKESIHGVDQPETDDVIGCQELNKNSKPKVVVEKVVMPWRAVFNDGSYDVLKYRSNIVK
jgi:hypothetical protein